MEKSCIWNFNYVGKEYGLPKSWEEFCETHPIKDEECYITPSSYIVNALSRKESSVRFVDEDSNVLPTAPPPRPSSRCASSYSFATAITETGSRVMKKMMIIIL